MSSLGIVVLSLNQERTYYANIGTYFSRKGVDVFRFTPTAIQPYTEQIDGEKFDATSKTWKRATFSIPDLLYDRCFYSTKENLKTNYPIVHWLKNRTTFLGHGLPGKWRVYECLNDDAVLRFYTIETGKATEAATVLTQLKQHKSLILKPENGSQGNGIFLLQQQKEGVSVKTQRGSKAAQKRFKNKNEFKAWLTKLLNKTTFLMQPFLSLQNQNSEPFDIRILLEKNEQGIWREGGRGIRTGKKAGVISNLHGGGRIVRYEDWLNGIHPSKRNYIEEEIKTIIERLPALLEQSFGELVELGLDIGVDKNGAVWIIETNSKPGHQVITKNNPNYTPLPYCDYLFQQKELNYDAQPAHTSEDERE